MRSTTRGKGRPRTAACVALAAVLAACVPRSTRPPDLAAAEERAPSSRSAHRTAQKLTAPRRIAAAFELPASGGIGDSVYAGLERLAEERNGEIIKTERNAPSGAAIVIQCIWSKLGGEDYEQILRQLAGSSSELVICAGAAYLAAAERAAAAFPGTRFVVIDAPASTETETASRPDNVTTLSFALDEGAFLAGVYAASAFSNKPPVRLGFIGGMDRPDIRTCLEAFRAGAAYASPAFRASGSVIAKFCGRTEAGFADPISAKARASSLYASGVDIIFHMAGASRSGVFEAAVESGNFAIDSEFDQSVFYSLSSSLHHNQFRSHVLGTVVKRGDIAVHLLVREYLAAGLHGRHRELGVAQGCVDFVPNDPITASNIEALARARTYIISGGPASAEESAANTRPAQR